MNKIKSLSASCQVDVQIHGGGIEIKTGNRLQSLHIQKRQPLEIVNYN
ncbi:hypothetical protein ACFL27_20990 [candidate division CSSED10-310 bacterium]|uniref:Uncharacterized protein n=1 Tax=candidate division CSSED10-310 bacterium TaxID=2855610 RepID=A0ABV6Z2K6_UNCC1